MIKMSVKISSFKSIIWRIIGVIYLFIISLLTTGSLPTSSAITLVHHTVFFFVFIIQDQAWDWIEWGKEYDINAASFGWEWTPSKKRSLVKGFVYEIIIAIPIMLLIIILITGNLNVAVTISFIYTSSKVLLYQLYEQVFDKIAK